MGSGKSQDARSRTARRGVGPTFLAGALVVAAAVFVVCYPPSRQALQEWWQLRLLHSADAFERMAAARKLAELRSLRAVPRLIELGREAMAGQDRRTGL